MHKNLYKTLSVTTLRRTLLVAGLLGGATLAARAQYPSANALSKAGTYTDLGGTGTAISTANFDDANSAATDIGFTFSYGGTAFTQFVLNTNGYLKLGATAPTGDQFTTYAQVPSTGPLASSDTYLVVPFNTDLQAGSAGTEYRVATTGTAGSRVCTIQWKNVSDKTGRAAASTVTATIPKQYANISFQVKFYEGTNAIEFVYGTATPSGEASAANFATVGLKGAGTASGQLITLTKPSNTLWAQPTFQDAAYTAAGNGFNFRNASTIGGTVASVLPDAGRTYHFDTPVANDATVSQIYNLEKVPVGQSYAYSAVVKNVGTSATSSTQVTLTLSGANSATQTQNVAGLAIGASAIVTFPAVTLASAGTTNVSVALANDGNNTNNTATASTVVGVSNTTTAATFSFINPTAIFPGAFGFGTSNTGAYFTNAFCAAITPTNAFNVAAVRAQLGTDANAVGQKVYAIVADLNGSILGQSTELTIGAADLNTLHTFALPSPIRIAAGTKFLVGLAQEVQDVGYFPMAYQVETPSRANTYYTFSITGQTTPTDITTSTTTSYAIRYGLEAVGLGTTLATSSPALARAISLYPNPSSTGVFSLESAGLASSNGLSVSVFSQVGQLVHRSAAPANALHTLDLSALSPGLYQVRVDNGSEFMVRQVAIVR